MQQNHAWTTVSCVLNFYFPYGEQEEGCLLTGSGPWRGVAAAWCPWIGPLIVGVAPSWLGGVDLSASSKLLFLKTLLLIFI